MGIFRLKDAGGFFMAKSTEKSGTNERNIKAVSLGALIGCAVFLICTLLLSCIMVFSPEVPAALYYAEYAAAASAAFVCGFVASKKGRGKGIILGIISGIPLSVIIMLPLWAIFGAEVSINLLLILPIVLLFSLFGGVVSANLK